MGGRQRIDETVQIKDRLDVLPRKYKHSRSFHSRDETYSSIGSGRPGNTYDMERGSDKHTPRLDDELEHETRSMTQGSPIEARSQEERMKEPPGDDEITPEEIIDTGRNSV